ncbi:MAG: glycosyltransferase, partial [Desulfitobacterium hafniense]
PEVRMIFVGSFNDPEGQKLVDDYIHKHHLEDNILFTGKVPHVEVEDYVRKSRIGAVTLLPLPKYYKNIPIKQFEYMSCGIPVVGSNLPPITRFLTPYHSGLIVDPTQPEEIAQAFKTLLADAKLRQEMGANGLKAVREAYNWGKMEERLLNLYARLEVRK